MDAPTVFAILGLITAVGYGLMSSSSSSKGGSVQHGGKHTRRHRRHGKKSRKH
jgi:hypothetical protein